MVLHKHFSVRFEIDDVPILFKVKNHGSVFVDSAASRRTGSRRGKEPKIRQPGLGSLSGETV